MAASRLTARIPRTAAKRLLAASSVAPVASGYERSCVYLNADACFSPPVNAICSEGTR